MFNGGLGKKGMKKNKGRDDEEQSQTKKEAKDTLGGLHITKCDL